MKPWTWRAAILNSNLMPTTRHVLLTLSCYVNDAGQSAYPSTLTLAENTGLSERAVITHLHAAKEKGWLKIAKHGFGGQKWARNEYFPALPDGDYDERVPEQGTEGGSVHTSKALNINSKGTERKAKGTEPNNRKGLKEVQSNNPLELSKNSPRNNPCASCLGADDFEQAWVLYPRRPGASKADALKAWNARIKAGATAEQIIDGVTRYAAYVQAMETEPQYIKQPATFFGPGKHYLSDWTPSKKGQKKAEKFDPTAYVNQGAGNGQCDATGNENTIDVEAKFVDESDHG